MSEREPDVPAPYRRTPDKDLWMAAVTAMLNTENPALKNALWRIARKLKTEKANVR